MRIDPICNYICSQLKTEVNLYNYSYNIEAHYSFSHNFLNPLYSNLDISNEILSPARDLYPTIYFFSTNLVYVRFTTDSDFYVIGPVRILFCESINNFQKVFDVNDNNLDYSQINEVTISDLLRYSLLLFNIFQTEDMDLWDCYQINYDTDYLREKLTHSTVHTLFENTETQRFHNPYKQEERMLRSISLGNVDALTKSWQEEQPHTLGVTAIDPRRNGKNMAQYVISASARAAIRGGLPSEYVLTLTDSYSQQVEMLNDMSMLEAIVKDIQLKLTQMVSSNKHHQTMTSSEDGNALSIIDQCKEYIFQHLHSRLTVQEIADELHVHPNYLSKLFHAQSEYSIYQYIMIQKIELAKNLLTYSDYTYLEIANYLGFTSQSHLGSTFKKMTGMTLKEYKDVHHDERF